MPATGLYASNNSIDYSSDTAKCLFSDEQIRRNVFKWTKIRQIRKHFYQCLPLQILQAVGNNSAMGRSRSDLTSRPDRRPRGIELITGEATPHGESARARAAIVEMKDGDVPPGLGLKAAQDAASAGDDPRVSLRFGGSPIRVLHLQAHRLSTYTGSATAGDKARNDAVSGGSGGSGDASPMWPIFSTGMGHGQATPEMIQL